MQAGTAGKTLKLTGGRASEQQQPRGQQHNTITAMRICNLTPHTIIANGVTIPASGEVARVDVTRKQVGNLALEDGTTIPAFVLTFGEVTGLPPRKWGTLYLVSAMVRSHPDVAKRKDVFSPGNLVRDENGTILGCDGLDLNFNAE